MAKTICIDVGHYGKYNAGRIKGYYESERMWKLGEYLIPELKAYGFNVVQTRTNQKKDLSLTKRAMVAVNNKADLFISLHSNAAGATLSASNANINGVVVFYSVQQKNNKAVAQAIADTVAKAMGTTVNDVTVNESQKRKGRDYYTVIDVAAYNGVPKVFILEHGFHTGTKDCTLLMDDTVLKKIAKAEAAYFAELLGVANESKEVRKTVPTSILKKGSKGNDVKTLQTKLNKAGYNCGTVDGVFGAKTLAAVKKFQKANGLTVDGIVGKNTWAALLSNQGE